MFAGETTISIIFKLLNFAVLIGLFVYLFKNYFLDSIKEQMNAKEQFLADLKHQKEALKEQQKKLEQQIEAQDIVCADFGNKIERWQAAVHEEEIKKQKMREQLHAKLTKKIEYQAHQLSVEKIEKIIEPQALEHAKATLEKEFTAAPAGQRFIEQLINYMERGSL
ncbi:MAG TPA: hypothetical protein VFF04_05730 [Candidatus Babeliales bacterium]|nr:hypothetical protein [Candidatus Babeliales bacterium]